MFTKPLSSLQDKPGTGRVNSEFSSTQLPVTSTLSAKTDGCGREQDNLGVSSWAARHLVFMLGVMAKGLERSIGEGEHLRPPAYITEVTAGTASV